MELTIVVVISNFRQVVRDSSGAVIHGPSSYAMALIPAFISHIKSRYPEAHLSVQLVPAADWLEPNETAMGVNPEWDVLAFISPRDTESAYYKEQEIREILEEDLAQIGGKISVPYITPPE